MFEGTIFENIIFSNPLASRQEVAGAAKAAFLDEFLEKLPNGIDTWIGERGQKLSGGQRQRIAIARVILKNPSILIFDEATSAVDTETEYFIQKSLNVLSKERTTLIIAHRLSTVVHADTILVLENGQIVEQGNHKELLSKNGLYSTLWKRQINQVIL
jgi:ABC-type multidrug transport system fused ATPase/permease subunit